MTEQTMLERHTNEVIALTIVIPFVSIVLYLAIVTGDLSYLKALETLAVAIVGFYFGQKTTKTE